MSKRCQKEVKTVFKKQPLSGQFLKHPQAYFQYIFHFANTLFKRGRKRRPPTAGRLFHEKQLEFVRVMEPRKRQTIRPGHDQ